MRIRYDDQDDILYIGFSQEPIVKDVSYGWNVNIGYAANGIAEITILDAKQAGYWPLRTHGICCLAPRDRHPDVLLFVPSQRGVVGAILFLELIPFQWLTAAIELATGPDGGPRTAAPTVKPL